MFSGPEKARRAFIRREEQPSCSPGWLGKEILLSHFRGKSSYASIDEEQQLPL